MMVLASRVKFDDMFIRLDRWTQAQKYHDNVALDTDAR